MLTTPAQPEKGNHAMKYSKTLADLGEPWTVIAPDGSIADTFTIPEESEGIAIYIDRPRPGQESQIEHLTRAARAFINAFDMALDELKELDPRAAEQLSAEYFLDD